MSAEQDDSFEETEVGAPPVTRFCENGVQFYPPAYVQRYGDVCDILKNDKRWAGTIQKVVDFGCAELSLFTFLKSIPTLTTILEVDFDEDLLRRTHELAKPLFHDHLFPRKTPLTAKVLAGSVADPDYRLIGCDAVLCIEIIEHLDPWAFDRMPHNIFDFIRPRLALITTPNADFNVLFPNLKEGGFRHWDHRFEWTREEFKDWAENVVMRYPDYTVEMIGVAPGPKGTEHLGCCSQMALFVNQNYIKQQDVDIATHSETESIEESHDISDKEVKLNCDNPKDVLIDETAQCLPIVEGNLPSQSDSEEEEFTNNNDSAVVRLEDFSFYEKKEQNAVKTNGTMQVKPQWDCRVWENPGVCQYYTSVVEYVYPFECDPRTREQKVVDEAMSRAVCFSYSDDYYNDITDQWRIPLDVLLGRMTEIDVELDELRSILSAANYDIQDDKLLYVKPQLSHSPTWDSSEASLEECVEACQVDDTYHVAAGDNDYVELDWNISEDEDQSWAPENDEEITASLHQPAPEIQEIITDQFVDDDIENLTLDSGLLGDSATSVPDDRWRPDSPLAQFLGANRDATEEQRLSDSGYLKSQDSPQSPGCSDSFSNDLITPDKDMSEMMVQSTILECIPENLNCPTSCCSPKDQITELPLESRRPSIGPQNNHHLRHNDFEVMPQNNHHLRHNEAAPQNIHNLRHNFEVRERLVRPDFLEIQNLEVAVVDHLNNNVDFEGNNFGADQRGRGEDEVERVHLLEVDLMDAVDNLLLGQLDRHNENHILHHQEPEEGIIMEAVLEYRENFQGNENDDLNPGALVDIPLNSQDTLPNTPLQDEEDRESSLETNYLLESIATTLGLNSQHCFYTADSFPSCSFQVTQECHLRSPKHHNLLSKYRENEVSLDNFNQSSSFLVNECDLSNTVQENDSFQCINNPEQEISFLEMDGNLLKAGESFFEMDGNLLKEEESLFEMDSNLLKEGESLFEIGGNLLMEEESLFEMDGNLLKEAESNLLKPFFETDGKLIKEGEPFFETDGKLLKDGESFFETDGKLLKEGEPFFETDGKLLKDGESFFETDGKLLNEGKNFFETDGKLLKDGESFFETDGKLLKEEEPFFEMDISYPENKYTARMSFVPSVVEDNINTESEK